MQSDYSVKPIPLAHSIRQGFHWFISGMQFMRLYKWCGGFECRLSEQTQRGKGTTLQTMAATFPEMTRTVSFGPMSDSTSRTQSQRSHSVVSIALYNENGEDDIVEIDEADDVFQDPVNSRLSSCECNYCSHIFHKFISFASSLAIMLIFYSFKWKWHESSQTINSGSR